MQTKKSITAKALVQRINRVLAKDGEQLKKSRGNRSAIDLGEYYVHDLTGNNISRRDVNIEKFGKSLGVLAPSEGLSE